MKELNEEQKKHRDELLSGIGKALIGYMDITGIPNYIEATYTTDKDGNSYKLRFEKVKSIIESKQQ